MPGIPNNSPWINAAIGLDEAGKISSTHFGDAPRILFARIKRGAVERLKVEENPLRDAEEGHGHRKKLEKAKAFLEDIQIIATGKASINFKRLQKRSGKWPVVSTLPPDELLRWMSEHLDEMKSWFDDPEHGVLKVPG